MDRTSPRFSSRLTACTATLALCAVLGGCDRSVAADATLGDMDPVARRAEARLREYAKTLPTLTEPSLGASFEVGMLAKFVPSARHGSADTRNLPRRDPATGHLVFDGPLATIVPVKGIEYLPESAFRHPVPVAIIDADGDYPTLSLQRGRNYWVVQRVDTGFVAWMQSVPASGAAPAPVRVSMIFASSPDSIAPARSARFEVLKDSILSWNYFCGPGRQCCKVPPQSPPALIATPPKVTKP